MGVELVRPLMRLDACSARTSGTAEGAGDVSMCKRRAVDLGGRDAEQIAHTRFRRSAIEYARLVELLICPL